MAFVTSRRFGAGNPRITPQALALVPCSAYAEVLGHEILGGFVRDYQIAFESRLAAAMQAEDLTARAIAQWRGELRHAADIKIVPDTAPILERFGHTALERRRDMALACRRLRTFRAALRARAAESAAELARMKRAEALVLAALDAAAAQAAA